jgi:integrase
MVRKRRGRQEGSVYERADGVWVGSVSHGYNDNGKRKRRVVYGESKKVVLEKLDKLRTDVRHGLAIEPTKLTLGEFLDRWLETDVRPNRAPGTYKSYFDTARLHIKPQLGGVVVSQLTPDAIASGYTALERKKVPARTRQLVHSVLHRALRRASDWKLIAWNPCSVVERPRVIKIEASSVTAEQARALLTAAKGHTLEALFVAAVTTGMRQGELFALRWQDVDFSSQSLRVVFSLEELNGKIRLKEPKSAKSRRTVELSPLAIEALKVHRAQMETAGFYGIDRPVFCDSSGTWLRKSNFIRNVYDPIRLKAGLAGVRFHDWRHFHASYLIDQGMSPKVLQERLGHADVTTTMRFYVHSRHESHRKAADAIDSAFAVSTPNAPPI